ncbi:MAG: terpene cyclase/mutase family protein [Chitinophagales bacterium]
METAQLKEERKTLPKDKSYYWNCWKLYSNKGRQYWKFELPNDLKGEIQNEQDWEKPQGRTFLKEISAAFSYDKSKNPNSSDLLLRRKAKAGEISHELINKAEQISDANKKVAFLAANKGFDFYRSLQMPDGNWAGDYGGPLFLLPGLVIVSYITQTPFSSPEKTLMIRYMLNHQNDDGGWGLHIEDRSTMFGTVLQYVALRLLGKAALDPAMKKARKWIQQHGGATEVPLWGKFYLSVLGVYEWEGNNTFYPEAWLLPESLPVHPSRYWNHARMVYMPMSYCYAVKLKAEPTAITKALKTELYTEKYSKIDWKSARDKICEEDLYKAPSKWLDFFNFFMNGYEKVHSKFLRKKTTDFLEKYIDAEDRHTNYINVGPVNQVLNSLCVWHIKGKESPEFKKHVQRWKDYLWVAEDGMKMNGYNGSQLWDTTFAAQALLECKLDSVFPETTQKIYSYLDQTQIQKNEPDYEQFFRDNGFGCWPFSTQSHDWPITDCTSEAMKSALLLEKSPALENMAEKINPERYKPAIDFLLKLQNDDGGWATYENIRGSKWLEKLNPSGIFADIMVEYSYVECTSATIQALKKYNHFFPNYRAEEIKKAIGNGREFILKKQRNNGSWYGSWAVCFTYGTWFGIEGLLAAGAKSYQAGFPDHEIQKACEFLVGIQKPDGSWGESAQSCVDKSYHEHKEGQVVNTAWALLALMAADYPEKTVTDKGIRFLIDKQEKSGDWSQQGISGVFNGNCMITYTAYRNVFPLWALGRYAHMK